MAIRVVDQPIVSFQGEQVTAVGSAGTRTSWNVRRGYKELLVEASATGGIRLQLVPGIKALIFFDSSTGKWSDILEATPTFLDREVATSTTALGSMAVGDYLYVGFAGIIGGFTVDMGATVNGVTATLTGDYSDATRNWTALSITDGSASAGATLAIDGNVTWTVPTNWSTAPLKKLVPGDGFAVTPEKPELFWARFTVSATLTAGIILGNLTVLGRIAPGVTDAAARTGGAYLKLNVEYTMDVDDDIGAVELIAQGVGTVATNLSWIGRR